LDFAGRGEPRPYNESRFVVWNWVGLNLNPAIWIAGTGSPGARAKMGWFESGEIKPAPSQTLGRGTPPVIFIRNRADMGRSNAAPLHGMGRIHL